MTSAIPKTTLAASIGMMWTKTGRTGNRKSISSFKADLDAMLWADVCVLVLPCGRSAHTEAGWFAGKGLKTIVYMPEKQEPELMYKLFDGVVGRLEDLVHCLSSQLGKGE